MKNKEIWLNLGCGVSLADNFINVDNFFTLEDLKKGKGKKGSPFVNARVTKDTKFVKGDMCDLPFEDNYADYVESVDAIEHISIHKTQKAFDEIYRVLRPGGKLGMSTTNFDELAKLWLLNVMNSKFETQKDFDVYMTLTKVIYGNQAGPGEYHTAPFNPAIMAFHLQRAGFKLENIIINIFPTNSPGRMPIKSYSHQGEALKDGVTLTEMMWVEAIK